MRTRYLADSLGLPHDWWAEQYSTSIRLIGPNGERGDVILPYRYDLEALKRTCAEVIETAKLAFSLKTVFGSK